jgi:hypothetical protein
MMIDQTPKVSFEGVLVKVLGAAFFMVAFYSLMGL